MVVTKRIVKKVALKHKIRRTRTIEETIKDSK
jgi:hypothetical protein